MGVNFIKNIEILVISLSCKFGWNLVLQIILLRAPRKKKIQNKMATNRQGHMKKNKKIQISKKI